MKDSNLRSMLEFIVPVVQSGRISISLEREQAISAQFADKHIVVSLDEPRVVRKIVRKVPRELKKISFLQEMSYILADQETRLEVSDKKGLLLGIGTGKHNMFGNLDVKPLRLIKYL